MPPLTATWVVRAVRAFLDSRNELPSSGPQSLAVSAIDLLEQAVMNVTTATWDDRVSMMRRGQDEHVVAPAVAAGARGGVGLEVAKPTESAVVKHAVLQVKPLQRRLSSRNITTSVDSQSMKEALMTTSLSSLQTSPPSALASMSAPIPVAVTKISLPLRPLHLAEGGDGTDPVTRAAVTALSKVTLQPFLAASALPSSPTTTMTGGLNPSIPASHGLPVAAGYVYGIPKPVGYKPRGLYGVNSDDDREILVRTDIPLLSPGYSGVSIQRKITKSTRLRPVSGRDGDGDGGGDAGKERICRNYLITGLSPKVPWQPSLLSKNGAPSKQDESLTTRWLGPDTYDADRSKARDSSHQNTGNDGRGAGRDGLRSTSTDRRSGADKPVEAEEDDLVDAEDFIPPPFDPDDEYVHGHLFLFFLVFPCSLCDYSLVTVLICSSTSFPGSHYCTLPRFISTGTWLESRTQATWILRGCTAFLGILCTSFCGYSAT